jgi:hypothetical protein
MMAPMGDPFLSLDHKMERSSKASKPTAAVKSPLDTCMLPGQGALPLLRLSFARYEGGSGASGCMRVSTKPRSKSCHGCVKYLAYEMVCRS